MLQGISVGSYVVNMESALGTGKQATVVKGYNIYSNERVAIKIFTPESHGAFTNETQFLAKLIYSQGDIVPLKSSFISLDNFGCIVMPLYCGDLFEYISSKKITSISARKYFVQICKSLQFSHDHGIAHLDIKPENVLIDENDQCVLCDFGHASSIGELVSGRGTTNYCPPESKDNALYDPITGDIWSLGILLYVLISGCFPRSNNQAEDDYSTNLYIARKYFSSSAFDLVSCILRNNPKDRPSIYEILKHSWCKPKKSKKSPKFSLLASKHIKKPKLSSLK